MMVARAVAVALTLGEVGTVVAVNTAKAATISIHKVKTLFTNVNKVNK